MTRLDWVRWAPYTCPPGAGAPSNLHPGSLAGLSSSRPYSVICLDLSFRKSLLAALGRKAGWGRGWGGRGKPLRWLWLSWNLKLARIFVMGPVDRRPSHTSPLASVLVIAVSPCFILEETEVPPWLVNWWTTQQGTKSRPAQSRCFPWLCSPRLLPWITCYLKAGAASDHFYILHGTCERRWPEKSAPPDRVSSFFSLGNDLSVALVGWFGDSLMIWLGSWATTNIASRAREEKFCLQKWSPKTFLPVYRPRKFQIFFFWF